MNLNNKPVFACCTFVLWIEPIQGARDPILWIYYVMLNKKKLSKSVNECLN